MMNPNALIECIANYSEGRREQVIVALQDAIRSVHHVVLLDRHSDFDHNRTVLTFAGPPDAIVEAAFRSIAQAAKWIDLNEQQGEHPRIGATDVVPFVPLKDATLEECVELAKALGRRVGDELGIPVYLYEAAASQPERQRLEVLRRGQFEGLKEAIQNDPERAPDFGPSRLGPAGATVIGARPPLVAYNIYLNSDDRRIAEQIAIAIRHSSGGMRYLKALGLLVEGQAQVSMNFTDFRHTPLHRVTELIRREAARYGVGLRGAELVGLIPQQALIDAACWYLQLDAFETDQVLETRLAQAQAAGQGQAGIQDLADPESAHASGVAAARTLILAAGLLAKVAGLIARRAGDQGATTDLQNLVARAQDLAQAARAAESADLEAVASWKNAHGSSFEDELHRQEAVQSALQRMAYSPLDVSRVGEKLLDLAEDLAGEDPGLLAPDVLAAAELAQSALKIAALNVSANLARLPQALRTAEECSQAEAIAEAGVARLVQLRSRLQT